MAKRAPARVYEDPRERHRAINLTTMLGEEIAQRRLAGQTYHDARREVCETYAGDMVRLAGKGPADQAIRAIHVMAPDECLTREERRRVRDRWKADRLDALARYRPEANSWLNRWHIRAFGVALYALVATVGLTWAATEPASALDAYQERWRALAACGRATIGTAEYDRRCRQFSRTERSTVRDYDLPGAGAPREWELPKEWE